MEKIFIVALIVLILFAVAMVFVPPGFLAVAVVCVVGALIAAVVLGGRS